MLYNVKSISLIGLNGYLVDIQVDVSSGIPSWNIVGLPDESVKESKERVSTAIKNSGYNLRSQKIVINLAPADIKKEGPIFDLPIAIGILGCTIGLNIDKIRNSVFIGELSLGGNINKVNGILPICIEAKKLNIKRVIVPIENANEASVVDGIEIIGVKNLREAVKYINNEIIKEPVKANFGEILENKDKYNLDFADVKGQENVKRALEIAAAGNHNCLMSRYTWFGKNNDG